MICRKPWNRQYALISSLQQKDFLFRFFMHFYNRLPSGIKSIHIFLRSACKMQKLFIYRYQVQVYSILELYSKVKFVVIELDQGRNRLRNRIEAAVAQYLPLLWPVRQSGAAVEHNDVILTNIMTRHIASILFFSLYLP